jgi:hypothetical protein
VVGGQSVHRTAAGRLSTRGQPAWHPHPLVLTRTTLSQGGVTAGHIKGTGLIRFPCPEKPGREKYNKPTTLLVTHEYLPTQSTFCCDLSPYWARQQHSVTACLPAHLSACCVPPAPSFPAHPPPPPNPRCLDEVITVAAMLSADQVFSAAAGLTGPQQGGPTEAAKKLAALAAQVRGAK